MPPSVGTLCDINVICTSLESTLNGLQVRCWHYGSIFIRLAALLLPKIAKLRQIPKIWPYSLRASKVIDLDVNQKLTCDFLLVINSNFGRICYRFRDIEHFISTWRQTVTRPRQKKGQICTMWQLKLENGWIFHPILVWRPTRRELLRVSGWNVNCKN